MHIQTFNCLQHDRTVCAAGLSSLNNALDGCNYMVQSVLDCAVGF